MHQENLPLVTVICTSFNHESFIRECLNGFVLQKTTFPFEVIVHDDASTDSTQQIVKEYQSKHPRLFNNIYQTENQFTKKEVNIWIDIMFPKARGKYIAICEGDDYWTDPYKLQKQVDFLECNKEFILCTHNYSIHYENTNQINNKNKFDNSLEYSIDNYFEDHYTPTLTSCWRNIFTDYGVLQRGKYFSDYFLFFEILKHGKGFFMLDNMATYRVHNQGVCSSLSEEQKIINHILMLQDLYTNNAYNLQVKKNLGRYNLIYFNFCIRIKKNKIPQMNYLWNYFKYEISAINKLTVLFIKLPYYSVRYWLRNLVSF